MSCGYNGFVQEEFVDNEFSAFSGRDAGVRSGCGNRRRSCCGNGWESGCGNNNGCGNNSGCGNHCGNCGCCRRRRHSCQGNNSNSNNRCANRAIIVQDGEAEFARVSYWCNIPVYHVESRGCDE